MNYEGPFGSDLLLQSGSALKKDCPRNKTCPAPINTGTRRADCIDCPLEKGLWRAMTGINPRSDRRQGEQLDRGIAIIITSFDDLFGRRYIRSERDTL